MTVSYSLAYANSGLGCFVKLLFRWRGSIYKLMWKEMVIFLGLYFLFCIVYRCGLTSDQQLVFEKLALYCNHYTSYIPLTFMLGFYVKQVIDRFNRTFASLPWPDQTMLLLAAYMPGNDEPRRIVRRTIARYFSLANILVQRNISTAVRKRFPTLEHVVNAGFMTEEELEVYENFPYPNHKYWIVLQWAINMLQISFLDKKISERCFVNLCEEIAKYRKSIATLFDTDWISLPLVYTQVVTIAVYSFFLACLFGRQLLKSKAANSSDPREPLDLYVPIFTILQFVFDMGWLKVAETLINPMGEDDDDFELNFLIDRNIQISLLIVDKNNYTMPKLTRDVYWDEEVAEVAHTFASLGVKDSPEIGSAVPVNVTGEAAEQFLPSECAASVYFRQTHSSIGPRKLLSTPSLQKQLSRISMPRKSTKAKKQSTQGLGRRKTYPEHIQVKQVPRKQGMVQQKYLNTVNADPEMPHQEKIEQILDSLAEEGEHETHRQQSQASVLESIPEEFVCAESRNEVKLDVTTL